MTANHIEELDQQERISDAPSGLRESQPEEDIHLLDLVIVVVKRRMLVLKYTAAALILGLVACLILPNTYTANTKILPPQQNQSNAAAVLGQLGGTLSGFAGKDIGIKNTNDLYIGMLRSRSIADQVIERQGLLKYYKEKSLSAARKHLQSASAMSYGKDGIISIDVDDRNPAKAAAIANSYVEELHKLNQTLAVTDASQRRLFFEQQLVSAKESLSAAENELKKTQQTTGMIEPDSQSKAIIESVAEVQAQIAAKEVQLSSMRSFATEHNPDLLRTEQELNALKGQLAKLTKGKKIGDGNTQIPTQEVPEAGLEYVRKLRDVKYYETMFELLAKQFELAKIDEARDSSLIQTLDKAVPPDHKSKPHRLFILIISVILGAVGGLVAAFVQDFFERAEQDPANQVRLRMLKQYIKST